MFSIPKLELEYRVSRRFRGDSVSFERRATLFKD